MVEVVLMPISSPDAKRTRLLAAEGAFLCAALMLSLAESFVFPAGILPIPGAKPGLANAAILMCATTLGRRYALSVSVCRVLLMFFLFGNATSVIYSVSGMIISFIGIALVCKNEKLSFLGKSVISAVLHNFAQILCAAMILSPAAMYLLPWMILAAILTGGISGIILNLTYNAVYKYAKKSFPLSE